MDARKEYPEFNVYKGLQKPLIFKGFKGKFIYIGGACIIGGLLLGAIFTALLSIMWGGIVLIVVMFGGLAYAAKNQKNGLHNKDNRKGIFIVSSQYSKTLKRQPFQGLD